MRVAMGPLSTKHNPDEPVAASTAQNNGSSVRVSTDRQTIDEMTAGDSNVSNDVKDEIQIYYAVHVPIDSQIPSSDVIDCSSSIFDDKQEALKLVKKYKRARFKVFYSLEEAKRFTMNGTSIQLTPSASNQSSSSSGEATLSVTEPLPLSIGEKPSPFKGPKSQDLVRLRKMIENGDIQSVEKTVWENPRYLVSCGDTPAILQEGSRYNALHVCAKLNKANICSLILKTITSVDFIKRLYGDNSESNEAAEDRCNVLLDLYLNTPDKGFNETPLHFAVKHGAIDVVRVLVAYSQCDKNMVNKSGQTPREIICSRVSGSGDSGDLYKKIQSLLEEQYFVPVLRSYDPSIQPTIGQPFSPSKPLQLVGDIVESAMEVQGVAGPMPLDAARVFRRKWKTPPRDPKCPVSPVIKTILEDPDKGFEKVGRELADENKVGWTEYWPFLGAFANFRTEEGLDTLEGYLCNRFKMGTESPILSYTGQSLDGSFSGQYSTASMLTSPKSPMSELCNALRSCRLSSGGDMKKPPVPSLPVAPVLAQQSYERYNGVVQSDDTSLAISPHLYIEKSCQVFARRIADGLLRCPNTPGEPIACEVVYLNMLVASCLNDSRFASVNFSRLHCRLASCIIDKFKSEDKDLLLNALNVILNTRQEAGESSSDEEIVTPYRDSNRKRIRRHQKVSIESSVRCITQHVSNSLPSSESINGNPSDPPSTEEECVQLWQSANVCDCVWSPQQSRLRQSFRRSNYSASARKIEFSPVGKGEKRSIDFDVKDDNNVTDKPVECCEESADEESDTSDTDCGEFFTPPSTPIKHCSPVSSEDDFEMESPDEGPDVFIEGDVPTSLDNAVLDALGQANLDPGVFPNICRWKHLVMLHSGEQRERWPSPRKSFLTAGMYRKMASTPSTPLSSSTPNYGKI